MPTTTATTRPSGGEELASGSTLLGLAQQGAAALDAAAITGTYAALTPAGATTGELVDAQRLTQLLLVGPVLAALSVARTRLPAPGPSPRPAPARTAGGGPG